ncbi:MAG: PAS domain-containing protein [Mucilaginibacter polytrichastri]|nr:PAS domain-containing protein [Mucilaginibacter polytrichastri]
MNTLSHPLADEPDSLAAAKQKIAELQDQLGFYKKILDTVPAGIYITTPDRKIQWCNHAYEKYTGYSLKELAARKNSLFEEIIHRDDWEVKDDKVVQFRNFFGLEFGGIFRAKSRMNNYYKWFISWARSFERDDNDHLHRVICVDMDMSHHEPSHDKLVSALKESLTARNNELAKSLTHREKEILRLICMGKNNREISEKLFLSHYTIETHRKNIRRKLHVRNPAELTMKARDIGLD